MPLRLATLCSLAQFDGPCIDGQKLCFRTCLLWLIDNGALELSPEAQVVSSSTLSNPFAPMLSKNKCGSVKSTKIVLWLNGLVLHNHLYGLVTVPIPIFRLDSEHVQLNRNLSKNVSQNEANYALFISVIL